MGLARPSRALGGGKPRADGAQQQKGADRDTGTDTDTDTTDRDQDQVGLHLIRTFSTARTDVVWYVGSLRHGLQRLAEGWQKAVDAALQTFVHLDFCGHEARVTGGVVRGALEIMKGSNLRSVDLANCRGISGPGRGHS